jgi:predicted metal-dependent enzyme (double-stranded beta helix superfamily)
MRLFNGSMDILDQLLTDTRDAMSTGQNTNTGKDPATQDTVTQLLLSALSDHERLGAAIRARPKPWFFAADETITMFCTQAQAGTASAPHDHGTWSVLGCFEGSEESWWHDLNRNRQLQQINSGVLRAGQAHALPTSAIHSVMNRWNAPNGIIHIYQGNFLAADRHIWDPITHERHLAGLSEPLAPAPHKQAGSDSAVDASSGRPALGGTAFAAITVNNLPLATSWMADTFGLRTLTDQGDSCAENQTFNYLIEPASLTIVGIHATQDRQTKAGLDHVALRVPTIATLEQWHSELTARGHEPSPITVWNFGTFVDVRGPEGLTIRLFVPAVR